MVFLLSFIWMKCAWSLTVRLLVASASSWTAKLLGLAAARISNQQSSVILDQDVLYFLLGRLVHIWGPTHNIFKIYLVWFICVFFIYSNLMIFIFYFTSVFTQFFQVSTYLFLYMLFTHYTNLTLIHVHYRQNNPRLHKTIVYFFFI